MMTAKSLRIAPWMAITALIAAAAIDSAAAQGFSSARVVKVGGFLSLDKVPPGSPFRVAIELSISDGYHVNAHKPTLDYLIPTTVVFAPETAGAGFTFAEPIYPQHVERAFSFTEGKKLRVYEGRALIGVEGTAARTLAPSAMILKGIVTVQACNDDSCLSPAKIPVELPITIAGPGEPIQAIHPEIFSEIKFTAAAGATGGDDRVERWVTEHGWAAALALIFLGGLALNLTPCVYPLIPITLAYFGGQAAGRPRRTFTLAAVYVVGMCLTYSGLGVLAATTGSILGAWLQSPVALVFVALVMVALGLSLLGLYELEVPAVLRNRIAARPGYGGALFMGLTVGLVAAPCIGPFVVSLLAYVGQRGSLLLGFSLFFVLSLGLGLPYLVLGGLAGATTGLPRAGAWMVWVRKLFGCVLFAMAFYFINPLLPAAWARFTIPVVLALSGLYLGFVEGSPIRAAGFRVARLATAGVALALAAWMLVPSDVSAGVTWEPYSDEAFVAAVEAGRPVIIDFTADWCLPCKELDHMTFTHPEVIAASARFVRLRADITGVGTPAVQSLLKKHDVLGAPTIAFFGADGQERKDLRLTGFEAASGFLERMKKID